MAPFLRRPRRVLIVALTIALLNTACSLMKSADDPQDRIDSAQQLSKAGKHADAARLYAELAQQTPSDHDNLLLLSAEQWVAGGNLAAAKQSFGQVSPAARTKLATSRALVAGEIALGDNDGGAAIRELDLIPVPQQAELAQNYWAIRGRAAFMTGHPVEGTRAFVERERFIVEPAALRLSRAELFEQLKIAAEKGAPMKPPPKTDPIVVGWLELAPVAVALARDPMHASTALANWQRLFPQHPANDSVAVQAQTQIAVATDFPTQVALLLPLSGRAEAVGVAVRDGFIAAYLEQDPAARPRLKIYDVAAGSVANAYNTAVADGAGFIVGPLTKEDVAAVAPLAAGKTPVLALNFLGDAVNAPPNFYQYALLPEDDARSVARRMISDGRLNGVAILPSGEWGNRVATALSEELKLSGGSLLESQRYDSTRADFGDMIKQMLQVRVIKGEPVTHRQDVQFVFIAGTAGVARLIMPQLKFHYVGDIPVYSTADSFEPDPSANNDLDGLQFPDMPWMVSGDAVTAQIRDTVRAAWPARTARRDRLYAFGFDAYRLVPALKANTLSTSSISGLSGKLRLDERNRIRRDLDWAQIKDGAPAAL